MNHETWKCAGPELERQIRCFPYGERSDIPGSVRPNARSPYYLFALIITYIYISGADTGFKVRGAKKIWVFRVKNHDSTPKNHIFSN